MCRTLNDKFIPSERHFFDGCFLGYFLPDFRPIFGAFLSAVLLSDKSYLKHRLRSWRVLVLIQVIVFLTHD